MLQILQMSADKVLHSVLPRVGHVAVAINDVMIVWGGYTVRNIKDHCLTTLNY